MASTLAASGTPAPRTARAASREVVLLITGALRGRLDPCGCGGQQAGGLSGRIAVLRRLRAEAPQALLLDAGDTVAGVGRQDQLKFQATAVALSQMRYDAVALGERDLALGLPFLQTVAAPAKLLLTCASVTRQPEGPLPCVRRVVGSVRVSVTSVVGRGATDAATGVAADVGLLPAAAGREVLRSSDLVVLVLHGPEEGIERLVQGLKRPCVVVLADPRQAEPAPPRPLANGVVVDAGWWGRYVVRLAIALDSHGRLDSFTYAAVPVTTPLNSGTDVPGFMRLYRGALAAEELVARMPQAPLPTAQRFAGSAACRPCHAEQHAAWQRTAHAGAHASLARVQADADPECIACHTVGFARQSGFAGIARTPDLAGIGCEACHGPSSQHVEETASRTPRKPHDECPSCHTAEHSPHFDLAQYLAAIRHR